MMDGMGGKADSRKAGWITPSITAEAVWLARSDSPILGSDSSWCVGEGRSFVDCSAIKAASAVSLKEYCVICCGVSMQPM